MKNLSKKTRIKDLINKGKKTLLFLNSSPSNSVEVIRSSTFGVRSPENGGKEQ